MGRRRSKSNLTQSLKVSGERISMASATPQRMLCCAVSFVRLVWPWRSAYTSTCSGCVQTKLLFAAVSEETI
jgi:hypothetical protein